MQISCLLRFTLTPPSRRYSYGHKARRRNGSQPWRLPRKAVRCQKVLWCALLSTQTCCTTHPPHSDQYVVPGNIIVRQRGTLFHPGQHVRNDNPPVNDNNSLYSSPGRNWTRPHHLCDCTGLCALLQGKVDAGRASVRRSRAGEGRRAAEGQPLSGNESVVPTGQSQSFIIDIIPAMLYHNTAGLNSSLSPGRARVIDRVLANIQSRLYQTNATYPFPSSSMHNAPSSQPANSSKRKRPLFPSPSRTQPSTSKGVITDADYTYDSSSSDSLPTAHNLTQHLAKRKQEERVAKKMEKQRAPATTPRKSTGSTQGNAAIAQPSSSPLVGKGIAKSTL